MGGEPIQPVTYDTDDVGCVDVVIHCIGVDGENECIWWQFVGGMEFLDNVGDIVDIGWDEGLQFLELVVEPLAQVMDG